MLAVFEILFCSCLIAVFLHVGMVVFRVDVDVLYVDVFVLRVDMIGGGVACTQGAERCHHMIHYMICISILTYYVQLRIQEIKHKICSCFDTRCNMMKSNTFNKKNKPLLLLMCISTQRLPPDVVTCKVVITFWHAFSCILAYRN